MTCANLGGMLRAQDAESRGTGEESNLRSNIEDLKVRAPSQPFEAFSTRICHATSLLELAKLSIKLIPGAARSMLSSLMKINLLGMAFMIQVYFWSKGSTQRARLSLA